MKKSTLLLMAALGCLCLPIAAQSDDGDGGFGVRISATADKVIMTGFHVSLGEELRFDNQFGLERSYTTLALSYKATDWLKLGLSYDAIAVPKSETQTVGGKSVTQNYTDWRHRASFDLTETYKYGNWRFSLRERLQMTHRTKPSLDTYQTTRNALALRLRGKVAYKMTYTPIEPYAFVEARFGLNDPKWDAASTTDAYATSQFLGFSDSYLNRLRAGLGLEWKINVWHSLDFYGFYDSLTDKDISAKRKKGVLKAPVSTVHTDRFTLGIAYKFSF